MTSKKKWGPPVSRPKVETKKLHQRNVMVGFVVITVILLITAVILSNRPNNLDSSSKQSPFPYEVANPATGAVAPDFKLPSTQGGFVRLSDYAGKTVLLFFHEGIGCQPCWDQIRDLEKAQKNLKAAGIDELLTITSGPTRLIAQKMNDDRLTAIALGDTNLEVSKIYNANQYGMMGDSRDGHTFVLVGPDGIIDWRADYGGPPNYTMYVPVKTLLEDMKAKVSAP